MHALYLASGSPRRRELLTQIGVPFTVVNAAIDETPLGDESPASYVERLARGKAAAGLATLADTTNACVLGADTAVILDGRILGKPLTRPMPWPCCWPFLIVNTKSLPPLRCLMTSAVKRAWSVVACAFARFQHKKQRLTGTAVSPRTRRAAMLSKGWQRCLSPGSMAVTPRSSACRSAKQQNCWAISAYPVGNTFARAERFTPAPPISDRPLL